MTNPGNREIRAAGVVLIREEHGAERLVCVVHRPIRADWSLPKGKLDPGEHIVAAARRETVEETGVDVVLGIPLQTQHYRVEGRPKTVRYWVGWALPGGPGFSPNKEIDELLWLPPRQAAKQLTYPRDKQLVRTAARAERTTPLIILRHAQAVGRARWAKSKPDELRPLASTGVRHAAQLADVLTAFGVRDVYSSNAVRCVDSVRPFAESQKLDIVLEPDFSEAEFDSHKDRALERATQILKDPSPAVICSHRPVLPTLVRHLARTAGLRPGARELDPSLPPGGFIVLHRAFTEKKDLHIAAVERHAP